MNGVDLKTAQELMRHSNIDTTMSIYTHVNNEHKKQVVNCIFDIKNVENKLRKKINLELY